MANKKLNSWHVGNWYLILAARNFGKGKVSVFTTSASPHWGINLIKWKKYDQLWQQFFTKL